MLRSRTASATDNGRSSSLRVDDFFTRRAFLESSKDGVSPPGSFSYVFRTSQSQELVEYVHVVVHLVLLRFRTSLFPRDCYNFDLLWTGGNCS